MNDITYMKKPDNSAIKIVKHRPDKERDVEIVFDLKSGDATINIIEHKTREVRSVVIPSDVFSDLEELIGQTKNIEKAPLQSQNEEREK